MAGEADDDFGKAFELISEADKKETPLTPEQMAALKPTEVPKTAEELAAETETNRLAAEEAANKAKLEADAGKTPEQLAAETEAARVAEETRLATEADAERQKQANASGADDIIGKLAKVVINNEAQERAAAAERDRLARETAARQTTVPQMSPEEIKAYNDYATEYPAIAKAESIVRRAELGVVTGHILKEVQGYIHSLVDPIAGTLGNLAERTHLGDLQTVIPDYDKLPWDKVQAWIAAKPTYLRGAYEGVMKAGDMADIKDMVDNFQKETGLIPAKAAAVVDATKTAEAAAAETARTKAAKALAPVASKRSGVAAAGAPEDFAGAFAAFAKDATDDKF